MRTGFIDLDHIVKLEGGKLIALGARPAMGKSTFALNIATNIAVREKVPVLYFNLENSKESIIKNIISSESLVKKEHIKMVELEDNEWERISEAIIKLKDAKIFIDDNPGISIEDICKKSRRMRKKEGIKFILIDYIQLISYNKKEFLSRNQEIAKISLELKKLSKELDIPIFVVSQLSRDPEKRDDHRPKLQDLGKTGALVQDADVVLLLYRDEYYNSETEKKDIAEIFVAKNRGGKITTIELITILQYCKFVNLERKL